MRGRPRAGRLGCPAYRSLVLPSSRSDLRVRKRPDPTTRIGPAAERRSGGTLSSGSIGTAIHPRPMARTTAWVRSVESKRMPIVRMWLRTVRSLIPRISPTWRFVRPRGRLGSALGCRSVSVRACGDETVRPSTGLAPPSLSGWLRGTDVSIRGVPVSVSPPCVPCTQSYPPFDPHVGFGRTHRRQTRVSRPRTPASRRGVPWGHGRPQRAAAR